jgi:hypothetical protein
VGSLQTTPIVPENKRARDRALVKLKGKNEMTIRLNRLFESDGANDARRRA